MLNKQQTQQNQLDSELLSACISGMSKVSNKGIGLNLFDSDYNRKRSLDAFYNSLKCSLSMSDTEMNTFFLSQFIPCVTFVDYDGYYIVYTKDYEKVLDGKSEIDVSQITTPKNLWMETYGDYTITYRLDNTLTINIESKNLQVSGPREKVIKNLPNDSNISFLFDKSSFEEEKNNVIVTSINSSISYFINTNNNMYNNFNIQYVLSISQGTENYKAKTIARPCMIAFAQGKQTLGYGDVINIYAITGTEIIDPYIYYIADIDSVPYYHTESCVINGTPTVTDKKNTFHADMETCAKHGALPCPYCIN